jgi:hypothetical protein
LENHSLLRTAANLHEEASEKNQGGIMKPNEQEKGAAGYIAAWALGVPISLLLIIFLLRGCT